MSSKFWVDGTCHICEIHCLAKCDGCGRFACRSHSKHIKQGDAKLDVCDFCFKHLKPGMKVAGVRITAKGLEV